MLKAFLHLNCKEILDQQNKDNMPSTSKVESTHTHPQTSNSFSYSTLKGFINYPKKIYFGNCVKNILVRHCSIRIRFHFLDFGLGVIERQSAKSSQGTCYKRPSGKKFILISFQFLHHSNAQIFLMKLKRFTQSLFHLIERYQHNHSNSGSSYHRWSASSPQSK